MGTGWAGAPGNPLTRQNQAREKKVELSSDWIVSSSSSPSPSTSSFCRRRRHCFLHNKRIELGSEAWPWRS